MQDPNNPGSPGGTPPGNPPALDPNNPGGIGDPAGGTGAGSPPPDPHGLKDLTPEQMRERLEREINDRKEGNNEAANLRKRLKDLEAAEEKRKQADLSDLEKEKLRAADLEKQVVSSKTEAQTARIQVAASKAGFADATDASALLDRSKLDDNESNLEELLKKMLKDKPHLKAGDGQKGGLPGTGGGNPGGTLAPGKEVEAKASSTFGTIKNLMDRRGKK